MYPAIEAEVPGGKQFVQEGGRGAQKARQLIGRIRRTEYAEHVAELLGELKQAIEHHVKEEESEVLRKTREALDTKRLDELGSAFEAAKGS